jgi:hypothetical protein
MKKREMPTKFWFKNLNGRDHLGDLDVDQRILLKWILKNSVVKV